MSDGNLVPFPGVSGKTGQDEQALADELAKMLASGQDGVEAGLSTTEFWLTSTAVVIDVLGPHYGFLQGIDANEQGLIALGLVVAYAGFRSWRKRDGPAALFAKARGQAPHEPTPTTPAAPAAEAPKAA